MCLVGLIERCRFVAVECLAEFAEKRQTMQCCVEVDAISGGTGRHHTIGEQPTVRRRNRQRHGQTFTVEVLEQPGLPRKISVAAGTQTTDRKMPVDTHAPHVVGDAASERFDASNVVTPLLEYLLSHGHIIAEFRPLPVRKARP